MKLKPGKISVKDKPKYMEAMDAIYTAISELKSRDEVKIFLKDILTESERVMLGRRILIAQRLLRDIPYEKIVEELKVGMDTITRVHQWLLDEEKGLEKAIRKLELTIRSRRKTEGEANHYLDPFSWEGVKRRYPVHFLFFNLIDKRKKE